MTSFVEKRPTDYLKLRKLAASGGSIEFMWGPNIKECQHCGTKYLPEGGEYCLKCGKKLG